MRLEKKVAVVTGAGAGIGEATALRFAREGARVLAVDIDGQRARQVVEKVREAGGEAEALEADVAIEESGQRIAERVLGLWSKYDILVNNAAVFRHKRVEDAVREDWERVMSVNVMGTSFCSKYAVKAMKQQAGGSIVNVASINGLIAMADWMTYNASKAAIVEISKSMSLDLGPFNIRVNCICPGVTLTPSLERVFVEYNVEPEQAVKEFISHRCHIKRFGRPDEIASAILFAASDEASYMTGATLVVDGGYSA